MEKPVMVMVREGEEPLKLSVSEEHKVTINGLTLHYLEWSPSKSPTLLLLHGYLSRAQIWTGLASELSRNLRVVALNQRGHGNSDWSPDGAYSIDDHFTDLARFIDLLDLKEIILMGHSMGGRNALFYTACLPDRVKKLMLVDARPGNSEGSISALKRLLAGLGHNADDLEKMQEKAEKLYPHLSIKETFERIFWEQAQPLGRSHSGFDPWLITASKLAGYLVEDLWPFMGCVTCPTLIIRGQHSDFLSPIDAENMRLMIPQATLSVIPRSSHVPMLENPGAFKQAVLSFLD